MTNFFYYSVAKLPSEMTPEELIQELRAAYHAAKLAEINQSGISTKEHVRKCKCENELLGRTQGDLRGIDLWNEAFAS